MNTDFEEILLNNEFIGIVEDNQDPDKKQRIRVRIPYLHGETQDIPTNHLPWCQPKRDLNGLSFSIPDLGKIVNVTFPSGNLYYPVYENSQHLNINLQKKIETYSGNDYTSFIALCYNHNTQIFIDNNKGLNIIHKFNGINLQKDFIAVNLKDNQSTLYLGDDKASQEIMLGTNFMEWMDSFMQVMISTAFIGNLSAPVVPSPQMINAVNQYFSKRQKFLSQHIYAIDNNRIRNKEFEVDGQLGDKIKKTNTSKQLQINFVEIDFKPVNDEKGLLELNNYVPPPIDGQPDYTEQPITSQPQPTDANQKVEKMIRYLKSQNYVIYEDNYKLNIVAIRNSFKDQGKITNKFDDTCWVFYKNDNNQWVLYDDYKITTTPGYEPKTTQLPIGPNNSGVAMVVYGQFVDKWKIGYHQNRTGKLGGKVDKNGQLAPEHKCLCQAVTSHIRNIPGSSDYAKPGTISPTTAAIGINIHHALEQGITTNVYNWSQGCFVFASKNQHLEFMDLCEQQVSKTNKGRFTVALIPQDEFDNFS